MHTSKKIRTFWIALLSLCFFMPVLGITHTVKAETDVWDGTLRHPNLGTGAKDNPFLITSAKELAYLLQNYDNNTSIYRHKYYRLTADLDLNHKVWRYGVSTDANRTFVGHFDGGGHKITNLHILIHDNPKEVHAGLFPQIGGDPDFETVIENLEVEDINVEFFKNTIPTQASHAMRIGGIVGQMYSNARLENCIVCKMTNKEYPEKVELPNTATYWVGPLVGDIQESFGGKSTAQKATNSQIVHSYGVFTPHFANLHSNTTNSLIIHQSQGEAAEGAYKDYSWYKLENGNYSFKSNSVSIHWKGTNSAKTAWLYSAKVTNSGNYTYKWKFAGEDLASTSQECEVPFLNHDSMLSVDVIDSNGKIVASTGEMVYLPTLSLHTTSITSIAGGSSFNIKTDLRGNGNTSLAGDFSYEWLDLTDGEKVVGNNNTLVGGQANHTYMCLAKAAKNASLTLSTICKLGKPVYVNLNGITSADDIAKYTFDGKTAYPAGDDANDGSTPEKAVRTLKRALELVKTESEGGSVASNVIVIMGNYDKNVLNQYTDHQGTVPNPEAIHTAGKPILLTGHYGNLKSGRLLCYGESIMIESDIRFENLLLYGEKQKSGLCLIYAQDHNMTFGYGIEMEGYDLMEDSYALSHGTYGPMFTVFGGFLNPDDAEYVYKPTTLRVLSGYYGRLIAGSRYTRQCYNTGNVTGTARHPSNVSIKVDIHNPTNFNGDPFDVGLLVGGQADGSIYACSYLEVRGRSRVGRIVGGNIGFGRIGLYHDKSGKETTRPSDSFFGSTTIHVRSGIVNEIYGASLGRNTSHTYEKSKEISDSCTTYFYGQVNLTISGGNVRNTIYGGGGGCVIGAQVDEHHHTFDPSIPYTLSNGQVAYGKYEEAWPNMPNMINPTTGKTFSIQESSITLNISKKSHIWGTVFGGSTAYSSHLVTRDALSQAGDVFGNIYVNMIGGEVEGYIYGGGCSTLAYFDNQDLTGYPVVNGQEQTGAYFRHTAQVYGETFINLKGGTVYGMVYGGGEGTWYRPVSSTDHHNITNQMGAIYGNTHVLIDSVANTGDYVYAGGNYSDIKFHDNKEKSGSTYVEIRGGHIGNSVFGAGHGHYDVEEPIRSATADIEGNTYVEIRGGEFAYTSKPSRYSNTRYYGVFGSGRSASMVQGNTYIDASRSLMSQQLLDSIGMHNWDGGKPYDRRYALAGGGFGDNTDVLGDTYITIHVDSLSAEENERFMATTKGVMKDFATIPGITFTDIIGGGFKGNIHGSTYITVKGLPMIRNIYGGSLEGDCGVKDRALNGNSFFEHSTETRQYTTRNVTNILSGRIMRIYGGSLMGNVCGETEINIGSKADHASNHKLFIDRVFGGNDVSGTIAGGNNPLYGTHINIYGGTIVDALFGAGDGSDINQQNLAMLMGGNNDDRPFMRERPHVASTMIRISGSSKDDMAVVMGNIYVGGNSTTVGLFERDSTDRGDWGLYREVLTPNSGRAAINIGSHVKCASLVMGSNGRDLLKSAPYSTVDGKEWYQGFIDDNDFLHFCRTVDMSCVPQLTFNADGDFHNNHPIDDRMGDILEFNTPGEMDAQNVIINQFVGGGYRGSMTCDSCYIYTLPSGVLIERQVVGGCLNAHFNFTEKNGPFKGTKRNYIGGVLPYKANFINTDRVQLNLFNQFADVQRVTNKRGEVEHKGAKVFGGCLDYGVIMGFLSVNFHSNLLGNYVPDNGETWEKISQEWSSEVGYIYAAGKGQNTEVLGSTYINIRGAVFNGEKCFPNCLNVFGGGLAGRVVGGTNVSVDIQCKGATAEDAMKNAVWGKVYGGGRMGDVVRHSDLFPDFVQQRRGETRVRVLSGYVGEVIGGARMANIENGCRVQIFDRSSGHFHTIIGRVFGGSDLSGKIGISPWDVRIGDEKLRSNTYITITENAHPDGTYSGFPLIGKVFGGGNGDYGVKDIDDTYLSGEVIGRDGKVISLAGLELPNVDTTYLEVTGGTIMELYGGANCSNVRKRSLITIDYGENRPNKAHFDRTSSEFCYLRGKSFITEPYIKDAFTDDGTSLDLTNNICRVYGGNNSSPLLIQPELDLRRADIGSIYGGCNRGDVLYYNEAGDRLANPGTSGSPGLWLVLNHDELKIGNVYGGSRMGNIRACKIKIDPTTHKRDTVPVVFEENQYGSIISVKKGTYGRIFGGNDVAGTVPNGVHIMLNGGQVGEVYGAGNGFYTYKWDPEVTEVTEIWDTELHDYVYHVPPMSTYGGKNANDVQKILTINEFRPNIAKSFVEVNGTPQNLAVVTGSVFSGGNCSTVVGPRYSNGIIKMDLGDYAIINNIYLGSNAEDYIGEYTNRFMKYNGITNFDQTDAASGLSLMDAFMAPVAIYGLPKDFHFRSQYNQGFFGSFYMGGCRGSLIADGTLNISFPRSLKIFDKIVGGSDRADIIFTDPSGNEINYKGGVLWNKQGTKPEINIDVQCDFIEASFNPNGGTPQNPTYLNITNENVDASSHVYSGCYQSGQVDGSVNIEINGQGQSEEIFF